MSKDDNEDDNDNDKVDDDNTPTPPKKKKIKKSPTQSTKIHKKTHHKSKKCQKLSKKSKILINHFFQIIKKKSSLFLNIRTTRFDQSSPVWPNPEKKKDLEKSQKIFFFYLKFFEMLFLFDEKKTKKMLFS